MFKYLCRNRNFVRAQENNINKSPYPDSICQILSDFHKDEVSSDNCIKCSSGCCSRGGFAILENVLLIYDLYKNNMLKRKSFKFEKGLNIKDFIYNYFDVFSRNVGTEENKLILMFFHMKSIDEKGRPISIPGDDYWRNRSDLFNYNPWLNHGCVFLSHSVPDWPNDDEYSKRYCILHRPDSGTHLGPKPIDCVFHICTEKYDLKEPKKEETDAWFYALANSYPNSKERFEKIMEEFKT
jgi:hypothetical protein